jgi:predicted TIM-barrel fold metal-dependent hydrolase
MNNSDPVRFFDAWTRVGPRPHKHFAERWSMAHLLDEMVHCSIARALVFSTQSLYYDAAFGNRELSKALVGRENLRAVWNVLPSSGGEFPTPARLIEEMREADVRAVAFHPKTNCWDWFAASSDSLFLELSANEVPVLLSRSEMGDCREIREFLRRYPELPVILTGASWGEQRKVFPLMEECPNLHLTFECFQVHYGLEDLVERGFEDRLLFASEAPLRSAGAHRAYVDYAALPQQIKAKVAGENLRRLLKDERPLPDFQNPAEDVYMAKARRGEPIAHIDMHMHILHEGLEGGGGDCRMHRGGPSGVFELLKRLGCRGGGFMSWNGTVGADTQSGNICTAAALDVAPKGFWGLASFDPVHYSLEEFADQIPSLYASDARFIGMKPYWVHGLEYSHPRYERWWEYGNAHDFYALIHRVRTDFDEVDFLAAKYPRVRWMVAHCASDFATADQAIACAKRHANVYLEITLTPTFGGIIDYLVEGAGSERVVYGSDLPMRDPRPQFGWVVFSRMTPEQKSDVLHRNAMRIIEPCLSRLPEFHQPGKIEPASR